MSDQDLDVNSGLMVSQESDKHQQQQVVHLMLGDQSGSGLVHHLVDSSLAHQERHETIPTSSVPIQHLTKLKKPVAPSVSQKELSKQWKILCKKAKEWCSLHGSYTPSFVMMYLDDNKLVWEGPDHMESFISDENVISAFLRTAVSTGTAREKRTSSAGTGALHHQTYVEETYMDAGHQNVSEAESTVVQALEQLGQMQPVQGSDSHAQSQFLTPGSSRTAHEECSEPGQCGDDSDREDDDSSDVKMTVQEEGSDVLSEVIDSVIKEWEPGQDTSMEERRARLARKPRPGIVVDTTVGTFEIVRNNKRKAVVSAMPSADTVKVLSINKQSPASYRTEGGVYREMVPCPECGKLISRNNLTAHVRIHKGEFRFKCEVCNKGFYNRKDMMVHYRIHTGERPFNCPVCFKAFRQKSKVKEHMLTHSGYKPHMCEHCQHSFARRSDLKCHLRLHTGEKPYQCLECGKRFSQPGNYRAHIRTHSRETRGQVIGPCDSCGRTYSSLASWKEHLRTHHSQLTDQENQEGTTEILIQSGDNGEQSTILIQQQEGDGASSSQEDNRATSVIGDRQQQQHLHQQQQQQHVIVDGTTSQPHHVLVDGDGQQIMVDLSRAAQSGTITLNMDGHVVDGGGEIRTILIDEQNQDGSSGMEETGEKWVVLTGEQAAKLMSMTH